MIRNLSLLACLCFCASVLAQKKVVDINSFESWKELSSYDISNDGMYVVYRQKTGSEEEVILVNRQQTFKRLINQVGEGTFTSDSKFYIFSSERGLQLLNLRNKTVTHILKASSFSIPTENTDGWLSYKIGDTLVLHNYLSETKKYYPAASRIQFSKYASSAVLTYPNKLLWIDLKSGTLRKIAEELRVGPGSFDESGDQYVFYCTTSFGPKLFYVNSKMATSTEIGNSKTLGVNERYNIFDATAPFFSKDGSKIFFYLKLDSSTSIVDKSLLSAAAEIWSYKDFYLQGAFNKWYFNEEKRYLACLPTIKSKNAIQIEDVNTELIGRPGNSVCLLRTIRNREESFYNKNQAPQCQILNLRSGGLKNVVLETLDIRGITLSQNEKYVFFLSNGLCRYNLFSVLSGNSTSYTFPKDFIAERRGVRVVKWLEDDKSFLLTSDFDLWQFRTDQDIAINLTGNYGASNKITFGLLNANIQSEGAVLLAGYRNDLKTNGFFRIKLNTKQKPTALGRMHSEHLYFPAFTGDLPIPVKAKNANVYLLQHMSARRAPNLLITSDFINFRELSNIHPEDEYNWLDCEMHKFVTESGDTVKGLLYKPEDFDPSLKYPVIFHYYEVKSNELHKFLSPDVTAVSFNIPYFVSNGYLVFVPDMDTKKGKGNYAQYFTDVAVSAARYLGNLPFVNVSRLGLVGHSWGGYITNSIVTRTKIFAAAISMAGISDWVMGYGVGFGPGWIEHGMPQFENVPWGPGLELYIKESPIFHVDCIETPLLLQNNVGDHNVVFSHGREMFAALRRQEKRTWLIRYDRDGHVLSSNNALDFTRRQKQFFDHYLKGRPAPLWMVEGIQSKYKGIKSGLQRDSLNRTP